MVRVIKYGKTPNLIFRGNCHNCKSRLEEDRDKLNVESCPREYYEFAHVICPVCNKDVVLYPEKDNF